MAEERIVIEISDEQLDAAIEKVDHTLEGIQSVDEAVAEVLGKKEDLPTEEELADISAEERRIISLIPGLREAYGLMTQIQTLLKLSPEVVVLLAAVMLIRELTNFVERQKKEAKDYEDLIRRYRHLSREEFGQWEEAERQRRETYHSQPPM